MTDERMTLTPSNEHAAEPASLPGGESTIEKRSMTVIVPGSRYGTLRDLWRHRELLQLFISRNIRLHYRQAALGIAWALLTPLLMLIVLSIFFGMLARLGPEGIPYAVFLFPALIVWNYFESAAGRASNSLIQNASLLTKTYFPRMLLPAASVISPLVDLSFAMIVLVGVLAIFGYVPVWTAVFLPAYLLLAVFAALGVGLLLSALNAQYRDVRHFLPVLMRLWFFTSPILYPVEMVPQQWRTVYALNPMVSVTTGFRSALLGNEALSGPTPAMLAASIAATVVMVLIGYAVFRYHERTIADVI